MQPCFNKRLSYFLPKHMVINLTILAFRSAHIGLAHAHVGTNHIIALRSVAVRIATIIDVWNQIRYNIFALRQFKDFLSIYFLSEKYK